MPILSTVGALATFKSTNFGVNFPYYAEFEYLIPIDNFVEISPYYIGFRQENISLISAVDGANPIEVKSHWDIT